MKQNITLIVLTFLILFLGSQTAMAIEEVPYEVVITESSFEIRDYAPYILAVTSVEGEFEKAGSRAFRKLFGYISGDNQSQIKIAMTAPVSQQPGEKIAMTAPVGQQKSGNLWLVSFMMPTSYSLENLPVPDNPEVSLRQIPSMRMATVRYSGFWNEKNYLKNKLKLDAWIEEKQLNVSGEAIWARYNAPFVPWFVRRNEILVPVSQ